MPITYPYAPTTGSASVNPNRYQIPGAAQGTPGRPTYGPNGVIIDSSTGQPFTGVYNNTHVKNGVQLQLNPVTGQFDTPENIAQSNAQIANDPSKRYAPISIPKNPDISDATSKLIDNFKTTADQSLKDFSDYLTNFKSDTAAAREAGKASTDVGPTISNLQNYRTQYNGGLDDATNRYRSALDAGQASENNIVNQAQGDLGLYDKAAQDVADRQQQAVMQQLSRYKLSTGTPTSLGSDEIKMLAQGVQDVQLPTQFAKAQQRYNVLGQYALPVARDIIGQNTNFAGSFLPAVAGSRFSANTGIENNIQNLKTQVANMSFDDATRYMQSLGIPWALQSQILSGDISNLGGLNALESGSRYQGLQDKLGVNVTQPQGYSFSAGVPPVYDTSYPSSNRYSIAPGVTSTASTTGGAQPTPPGPQSNPLAYLSNIGLPGFPNTRQMYPASNDFVDDPRSMTGDRNYFA
jgi:hypothetical protein